MILYEVRTGIISPLSVVRETKSGWRCYDGGFINRRTPGINPWFSLRETYYTSDLNEAKRWSAEVQSKLADTLQVAKASVCDLEWWQEDGADEDRIPKSRVRPWDAKSW